MTSIMHALSNQQPNQRTEAMQSKANPLQHKHFVRGDLLTSSRMPMREAL